MRHRLFHLYFLFVIVIACKEEHMPVVELSQELIETDFKGGEFVIDVNSNCNWKASPTTDWLSVTRREDGSLIIIAKENNNDSTREGKIVFFSDAPTSYVTVRQEAQPVLRISDETFFVSNEEEVISINVKSNHQYQTEITVDWITEVPPSKGIVSTNHLFRVSPNIDYEEREARIIFYDSVTQEREIVSIRQQALTLMALSQESFDIGPESTTLRISLTTNMGGFIVEPGVSWIQSVETKGIREEQIILYVSENNGTNERTGHVLVTEINTGQSARITVKQGTRPFIIIPDSLSPIRAEGGLTLVNLQANVEYSAFCDADWLQIIETDRSGITVYLQENHSYIERDATIGIKATDGIELSFVLVQEGMIPTFSFTHSASTIYAPLLDVYSPGAFIDWGDGEKERYSSLLLHPYTDLQDTHIVTITAPGASEIRFENMSAILELDLSSIHQ